MSLPSYIVYAPSASGICGSVVGSITALLTLKLRSWLSDVKQDVTGDQSWGTESKALWKGRGLGYRMWTCSSTCNR